MTDLKIARIGSLEDGDDPSDAGRRSYNSWRYADEASLYSIAEDSREGQSSRGTASVSHNSSQLHHSHLNTPGSKLVQQEEGEMEDNPIEVRWVTAEEIEEEEHNQRGGLVPIPYREPEEKPSSDIDDELGPQHNARRSLLYFLLLICAVLVIVLSLTLSLSNRGSEPNPRVSGGIADTPGNQPPPVPSPTAAPTLTPTLSPTYTQSVHDFILSAILSCDHTTAVQLQNTWPHTVVFDIIKTHVSALVTVREDGFLEFDPKLGRDYVLELFAMLMLFMDTTGEYWTMSQNWYSDKDVCEWYNQATDHCIERVPGSAAVTKIKLCKFLLVILVVSYCDRSSSLTERITISFYSVE